MPRYAFEEGVFHIDAVPGQPQMAHCHGFVVFQEKRGQGNGHVLKKHQMALLRAGKFDFATCTVAAGNRHQISILSQAGWQGLTSFRNEVTGDTTHLFGWHVDKAEEKP